MTYATPSIVVIVHWKFHLWDLLYIFLCITTDALISCGSLFSSSRSHLLEMATTAAPSLQIAAVTPSVSSSRRLFKAGAVILGGNSKAAPWNKLTSACHISSVQPFQLGFPSSFKRFDNVTKAMSTASENKPATGLPIDLRGQFSFPFFFLFTFHC